MPVKDKKNKITGHVLFLKEAWREKEKIITGHILFWKEVKRSLKKKKKRNRPLYVNTLFYHDLCCSLFQSVELIPLIFHWGTRESFREGFWDWAMYITLCFCETQGWDNLTMCTLARVGCSHLFFFLRGKGALLVSKLNSFELKLIRDCLWITYYPFFFAPLASQRSNPYAAIFGSPTPL